MEAGRQKTKEEQVLNAPELHGQGSANEKVWRAVIDSAIADWVRGPISHKRKAEYFLFQDEVDFPFVCRAAGLNPASVRESLWAIRAQAASAADTNVA
jgi:hypothetical protein